ncbi:MAG: glycosyltransferase [Alphaproteobacteria bacterium]|nr:glycosyltransferase [Alphaproteobacteria bacterium]
MTDRAICICVVGTRPEVIKMAAVIARLGESDWARPFIVSIGQHAELLDRAMADFGLVADHHIAIDRNRGSILEVASQAMDRLDALLEGLDPACVIAQGDTTTVMAASLEFAEWHSKDLVVRESMTGVVPCAGVSACFSHRAIDALRQERAGEVFSTTSLTEDYDIAFRLAKMGMREIFVRLPISLVVEAVGPDGMPEITRRSMPVATREFFPEDFRAAYRQLARWLLGIAFQGWTQHGWEGNLGAKYFFLRDRKGLITAPAAILAYFAMFSLLVGHGLFQFLPQAERPPYALLGSDLYRTLLWVNLILLGNRLVQRTLFTTRIYGIWQGLMAGPRMIVSNLLNFFATLRAAAIFARHKATGKPIVWDKTTHSYPFQIASGVARLPG